MTIKYENRDTSGPTLSDFLSEIIRKKPKQAERSERTLAILI